MSFPCTSCGLCCRNIKTIIKENGITDPDHHLFFPYKWDEDGACEKLVDDKCSIYEDRPPVCNVDEVADFLGETKEEFYPQVIERCNKEMDKAGMDEKFRIDD